MNAEVGWVGEEVCEGKVQNMSQQSNGEPEVNEYIVQRVIDVLLVTSLRF